MKVTPLTPLFAARVEDVDLARPLPDEAFAGIRAAFEAHSVLVFPGQPLDDEAQAAFSRRFGPLEVTLSANPASGTTFQRQSNLDIRTGEVIPPDDRRMLYQLANQLWHSDSSFKKVPSLCSILTGRIVPPEGGATEFASARAAYAELPDDLRRRVEGLVVVHDFTWSRDQVRPGILTDRERSEVPPVQHPLVRANPVNGRRTLFIGAHASHIVGMSIDDGRALLRELTAFVTQPRFCYRHEWAQGDLVVWDNRCVLHRATPFDATRYHRFMQRTTVSGDPREGYRPARLTPLEPPYSEAVTAALQKIMPPGVDPLVLFRALAINERVFLRLMAGGLLDRGSITLREREIVIDRTCARCGSEYEWGVHVAFFGERVGFTPEQRAGTCALDPAASGFPPREQLLLRLVDELHDTSRVGDGLWAELRAEWSEAQLIELVALVGFYHLISFCANAFQLPREPYGARFPGR